MSKYVGGSFITNNEKEIYPIIDYLKERLPNAEYIDFVDEGYISEQSAYYSVQKMILIDYHEFKSASYKI